MTPDQVVKFIDALSNSKSCGIDGIPANILKLAKHQLKLPLTWIINTSLRTGKFPRCWKTAKIIPLFKCKGCPMEAKNYRPVSLLSPVSKILECCVVQQIEKHMTSKQLWHPAQNACRGGRSTTTALLQLSEHWMSSVEGKWKTVLMLVDLSAAFDCINSKILKSKLERYNCGSSVTSWVENYMMGRLFCVSVGGKESLLHPIESGVPQGSCLGPLLFIIFTNDMLDLRVSSEACTCPATPSKGMWQPRCHECCPAVAYADDTTIVVTARSEERLEAVLNGALNAYEAYLTANRMVINTGKTEILRTGFRLGSAEEDSLRLEACDAEGNRISPKESCRLLGLILGRNMNWNHHLMEDKGSLHARIRKRLSALKILGKYVKTSRKIILANGLVNSLLVYCVQLWGIGATKKQLRQTQVLQNQTAKWALGWGKGAATSKVLKNIGWLSVTQLVQYHAIMQLWKLARGEYLCLDTGIDWQESRTQGSNWILTAPYRMEFMRRT